MRFDDIQPLMLFCFVAKNRSLSKASELLEMHRTTLVRNIQKLEQSQGKQLMLFEPNKVVLTSESCERIWDISLFTEMAKSFWIMLRTISPNHKYNSVYYCPDCKKFDLECKGKKIPW